MAIGPLIFSLILLVVVLCPGCRFRRHMPISSPGCSQMVPFGLPLSPERRPSQHLRVKATFGSATGFSSTIGSLVEHCSMGLSGLVPSFHVAPVLLLRQVVHSAVRWFVSLGPPKGGSNHKNDASLLRHGRVATGIPLRRRRLCHGFPLAAI